MAAKYLQWGEPGLLGAVDVKYLLKCTVGDVNSATMLFFDNFSSLIGILGAIISLPRIAYGFNPTYSEYSVAFEKMVFRSICPGIGMALIFGNVWYAWMASKLAAKESRKDVTALPYGINTPAGFLTAFTVMLSIAFKFSPAFVKNEAGDPLYSPDEYAEKVFHTSCCANFIGGMFEVAGIPLGNFLRDNVPRAALFAPICGVGFVWLGFVPLIDVMREPIIGFLPMALIFTSFFANGFKGVYHRMIPMSVIIMLLGTALWWAGLARWDTESRELNDRDGMADAVNYAADTYVGKLKWTPFVVFKGFEDISSRMVAIQFPIALASFLETIENTEAAALEGDSYNVNEVMLADGLGTMFGAMCGSVIPTTVYIGHKRHKAAGAASTYSLINGIVYFILTFSGLLGLFFYLLDPVSVGCILIAVGLMIAQQTFETSASRHVPALLVGLMFPLAEVVYFDMFDFNVNMATRSQGRMHGVSNMMPGGGIMCSLMVTAILCDLIDQRFIRASVFCAISCLLSLFGMMHGNNHVFGSGERLFANQFTTDLGEIMSAIPKIPDDVTTPGDPDMKYRINMNPLPFPLGSGSITYERVGNEGWRFAVAYAALCLFCLAHAVFQNMKPGSCVSIMDNGKVEAAGNANGSSTSDATYNKATPAVQESAA